MFYKSENILMFYKKRQFWKWEENVQILSSAFKVLFIFLFPAYLKYLKENIASQRRRRYFTAKNSSDLKQLLLSYREDSMCH